MILRGPYINIWGGPVIGENTKIGAYTEIGKGVVVGDNCSIQARCLLYEGLTIEDNVFVGPGVIFLNDVYPPSYGKHWKKTLVKRGAAIGGGAVILPGVVIGENSLVGAGSVVKKDIPAGEIWCGNPCAFLRKRDF
jgi:acetyltransferase-like isoleucine patch superfamily enzyme